MIEKQIKDIISDMIIYFDGDVKRINHALKVYSFAKNIGELEGCTSEKQYILEIAAVLHDIGIKESERKYHSSLGKYQQIEGPPIARDILKKYDITDDIIDRVCFLIGNHHSYNKVDDIDFQILIEADFIVNIYEDKIEQKQVDIIKDKYFKTETGKRYIDSMY